MLKRKKLRWYIIDPQSTQMQCWDLITALALIFTALVTPLEVGFMESATHPARPPRRIVMRPRRGHQEGRAPASCR